MFFEICSPHSENGPSTEDLQAAPTDPTVSVQRHNIEYTKHPSLEHDDSNNPCHDQATPAQEVYKKPRDHTTYSSSQSIDQQPACDQATLHLCLRPDHTCPETSQPGIGIFAHGPRTLLVIITEL